MGIYMAVVESEECMERIACEVGGIATDAGVNKGMTKLAESFVTKKYQKMMKNFNSANDAMTTVKRFIDRLGTQKSRSCQKSTKPAIYLRTLNEAQNQSKLPRSIFCGSHTVCEIHTYLFYLLTQKATKGERSLLPMERIWQRAFQAQNFS